MVELLNHQRRCLITGNPYGTDTWKVGSPCRCQSCQDATTIETLTRERDEARSTRTEDIMKLDQQRDKVRDLNAMVLRYASRAEAAEAEVEKLKAERATIVGLIPMDYLQRHDAAGATGPTQHLKLDHAMREYVKDRWKIIDRVRDLNVEANAAEARATALEREVERLKAALVEASEVRIPYVTKEAP